VGDLLKGVGGFDEMGWYSPLNGIVKAFAFSDVSSPDSLEGDVSPALFRGANLNPLLDFADIVANVLGSLSFSFVLHVARGS